VGGQLPIRLVWKTPVEKSCNTICISKTIVFLDLRSAHTGPGWFSSLEVVEHDSSPPFATKGDTLADGTRAALVQLARSYCQTQERIVLTRSRRLRPVPAAYLLSKEAPSYQEVATVLIENKGRSRDRFSRKFPVNGAAGAASRSAEPADGASVGGRRPSRRRNTISLTPHGSDYGGITEWISDYGTESPVPAAAPGGSRAAADRVALLPQPGNSASWRYWPRVLSPRSLSTSGNTYTRCYWPGRASLSRRRS